MPPLDFCCGFGGGGSEFLHKFDLTPSLLLVATCCCLWWLPVRLIRFSFEQPVCPYIIFPHVVPPAGNVLHFHRRQGSKRSPERPFLFFFKAPFSCFSHRRTLMRTQKLLLQSLNAKTDSLEHRKRPIESRRFGLLRRKSLLQYNSYEDSTVPLSVSSVQLYYMVTTSNYHSCTNHAPS